MYRKAGQSSGIPHPLKIGTAFGHKVWGLGWVEGAGGLPRLLVFGNDLVQTSTRADPENVKRVLSTTLEGLGNGLVTRIPFEYPVRFQGDSSEPVLACIWYRAVAQPG